jgi:hypothetical protein
MKFKTTKKEMRDCNPLRVGYCKAQYLLSYESPIAYSAGDYGWACDYYNIDGVWISTGYSPIGRAVDYEMLKTYEYKAAAIQCDYSLGYEEKKEKTKKLLKEWIEVEKHG